MSLSTRECERVEQLLHEIAYVGHIDSPRHADVRSALRSGTPKYDKACPYPVNAHMSCEQLTVHQRVPGSSPGRGTDVRIVYTITCVNTFLLPHCCQWLNCSLTVAIRKEPAHYTASASAFSSAGFASDDFAMPASSRALGVLCC